jgi:predicted metal-dependent hydrolase
MDFFFGEFFSIKNSSKFSNFFYIIKVRKKNLFIVQWSQVNCCFGTTQTKRPPAQEKHSQDPAFLRGENFRIVATKNFGKILDKLVIFVYSKKKKNKQAKNLSDFWNHKIEKKKKERKKRKKEKKSKNPEVPNRAFEILKLRRKEGNFSPTAGGLTALIG